MSTESSAAPTPEMGLRARKRWAAIARVERLAIELGEEHGYEGVSVEMLCRGAEISERTFFNYFRTKEEAFLGLAPPEIPAVVVDEFVASRGHVVEDLVQAVLATGRHFDALLGERDDTLLARRVRLVEASPALLTAEMGRFAQMDAVVIDLVLARFAAAGLDTDSPDVRDRAALAASLTAGVMRQTMTRFVRGDEPRSLDAQLRRSVALVRDLFRQENQ